VPRSGRKFCRKLTLQARPDFGFDRAMMDKRRSCHVVQRKAQDTGYRALAGMFASAFLSNDQFADSWRGGCS